MIGRKTTLVVANLALGAILGLVATTITARWFGPEPAGEVTYALGILGILFFITDLGMSQAHVKRVSEGRDPGDCFATYAVFKAVSTAVFTLLALAIPLYSYLAGRTFEDSTIAVYLLCLTYFIFKSIQEIGQSSFDAKIQTARSQAGALADTILRVGLTIVAAFLVGPLGPRLAPDWELFAWFHADPGAALALATAVGGFAGMVVSIVLLLRGFERGRFRMELLRDYASFAFPLFLTVAVSTIAVNVDAATIGLFLSKAEAGIFGQVRRLPGVLQSLGAAVGLLLFPTFSALAAAGNQAEAFRSMDRALRYLSALLVPIVAFTVVFAADIIHIVLRDEFLPGTSLLQLLSIYTLLLTFSFAYGNLLMGYGRPGVTAKLGITASVIVIVLDLTLVPYDIQSLGIRLAGLGLLGVGIATLASGLFTYVALRIASRRILGYREGNHLWKHLAAAAVMIGVLVLVDRSFMPIEHWYHLLVYGVLGAGVYAIAMVAVRELTREDVAFIQQSVHPVEMLRYLRSELFSGRKRG